MAGRICIDGGERSNASEVLAAKFLSRGRAGTWHPSGHAGGGVGRGYGTKDILARYGTAQVAEAVESIRYPNLDLQSIRWPAER